MPEVVMSIWDHLDELSHRLRVIAYSLAISSIVVAAFPYNLINKSVEGYSPFVSVVLKKVQNDLLPQSASLIAYSWWDPIWAYLLLSVLLGAIASSPVIAYELYKFFNPALLPSERRPLATFIISVVILFISGAVFTYFLILPITFTMLLKLVIISGALPIFALRDFISFVVWSIVGIGIAFTFPIWITLMVKLGWISPETLATNRRVAIVVILVIAGIITPDPTVTSMLILSIPLIILYEISIWAARLVAKSEGPG